MVILVVASDGLRRLKLDERDLPEVDGLVLRRNEGYDFDSWAAALRDRPDLCEAALLAMTNDSVFGPLDGFAELLARVEAATGDVVALMDSHEVRHHTQSYLVSTSRRR